jgi:hypothetical protein
VDNTAAGPIRERYVGSPGTRIPMHAGHSLGWTRWQGSTLYEVVGHGLLAMGTALDDGGVFEVPDAGARGDGGAATAETPDATVRGDAASSAEASTAEGATFPRAEAGVADATTTDGTFAMPPLAADAEAALDAPPSGSAPSSSGGSGCSLDPGAARAAGAWPALGALVAWAAMGRRRPACASSTPASRDLRTSPLGQRLTRARSRRLAGPRQGPGPRSRA